MKIGDNIKTTLLVLSLPLFLLIQGLIELKDMITDGEHYMRNGRGGS